MLHIYRLICLFNYIHGSLWRRMLDRHYLIHIYSKISAIWWCHFLVWALIPVEGAAIDGDMLSIVLRILEKSRVLLSTHASVSYYFEIFMGKAQTIQMATEHLFWSTLYNTNHWCFQCIVLCFFLGYILFPIDVFVVLGTFQWLVWGSIWFRRSIYTTSVFGLRPSAA